MRETLVRRWEKEALLLEPNASSGSTRVRRGAGSGEGVLVARGVETRAVHGSASVRVRERAERGDETKPESCWKGKV